MTAPLFPSFTRLMPQNGLNGDCAVATIAMACLVNYEEALSAAVQAQPAVLETGMSWTEIREACDMLGCDMKLVRRGFYNIDEDSGILNVKKRGQDHVCVLWEGRIIEGGRDLWLHPDEYLRHYGYKPYSLLVRIG
jgi:hypothetical protein